MKKFKESDSTKTEMLALIHAGKTWTDVYAVNEVVWNLPKSTFSRYWKAAQEEHTGIIAVARRQVHKTQILKKELEQHEIDEVRKSGAIKQAQLIVQGELDRVRKAILTREEGLEILTGIARGEESTEKKFKNGVQCFPPTPAERIMALKLIAEIDYWTIPQEDTEDATIVEFTDAE